ncbi:MAG TPA: DUF2203 domain-containing protein [Bryobacteraceae bacterium]|nr:DUF2203 domain-containing protein [Bryobacteraceae bacterium]
MPKRFTLAEARELIPEVSRLLREAVDLKSAYDGAENALHAAAARIASLGGVFPDIESVRGARARRDSAAARLPKAIQRIQEIGCVVKDLDTGLVDFPTRFRGAEVYLCWKLGERTIEFWHGVDEGFAGRKTIDREFREKHRGDPEQ